MTSSAKDDISALRATDRAKAVHAIETHLHHEPEKVSKSRIKRLENYDDPDDWWEELLLRDPRFKARIAQARQEARAGQVFTLEEVRAEFGIAASEGE